mgnify:CR=1 FL=1
MSYKAVTKFNVLAGGAPSMGCDYEYVQQIKNQAKRVYEEVLELMQACEEESFTGILDAFCDIRYTNEYLEDLLKAGDVQTEKAWLAVCENNLSKFTTSYTYAADSKEYYEEKGVECYIESTAYDGETYFCIKRSEDNKVLKPHLYESVDLGGFVPKELK